MFQNKNYRNATIMKIFGLLDFGERADSGIPDLFDVCNSNLGTQPDYNVAYAPARSTLTIGISKMIHTKLTIMADGKRTIIIDYIRKMVKKNR